MRRGRPGRAALSELICDAPACRLQEPALERTHLSIILEIGDVFGDRYHRFLDHVLRFSLVQTAFDRDAIDEFPVGVEEILPTLLILPILEALDQSCTGANQGIVGT